VIGGFSPNLVRYLTLDVVTDLDHPDICRIHFPDPDLNSAKRRFALQERMFVSPSRTQFNSVVVIKHKCPSTVYIITVLTVSSVFENGQNIKI